MVQNNIRIENKDQVPYIPRQKAISTVQDRVITPGLYMVSRNPLNRAIRQNGIHSWWVYKGDTIAGISFVILMILWMINLFV